MKKYTTLEEFTEDFAQAPSAYNMLVDLQSIQNATELYSLVINMVFISTDPEDGEIYRQNNAINPLTGKAYPDNDPRFSLTHRGLMKIRAAADAQFVEVKTETDKVEGTVTATVIMKFRSPTGAWAEIIEQKTKSARTSRRDGTTYPDNEAHQKAISGAQNRCIRKAFNIKNFYPMWQLQNPFVVAYRDLNDQIKEVREAKILAAIAPTALLYGTRNRLAQLAAHRVDEETGEVNEGGSQP